MLERARPDEGREASGLLRQAELPLEARKRPSGVWSTSRSRCPSVRRPDHLGCLQARGGPYEVRSGVPEPQGAREVALPAGGGLHSEADLPEQQEPRAGGGPEAADAGTEPPQPRAADGQEDPFRRPRRTARSRPQFQQAVEPGRPRRPTRRRAELRSREATESWR